MKRLRPASHLRISLYALSSPTWFCNRRSSRRPARVLILLCILGGMLLPSLRGRHAREVAAIDPAAAGRTADEVFAFILGRIANAYRDVLSAGSVDHYRLVTRFRRRGSMSRRRATPRWPQTISLTKVGRDDSWETLSTAASRIVSLSLEPSQCHAGGHPAL
jgi:hypothetical protein